MRGERERYFNCFRVFVIVCVLGTGDKGVSGVSWVGLNPTRPPINIFFVLVYLKYKSLIPVTTSNT